MPRQTRVSVDTANVMMQTMRHITTDVMSGMIAATTDTGLRRPIDWMPNTEFERLRMATINFLAALEINRQARANIQQSR